MPQFPKLSALRSLLFGSLLSIPLTLQTASAQHPICGKPPEWDVKSADTERLKGDLQDKAQSLTAHRGPADLAGQIQTERSTIYRNSDQHEALRRDAYLAYIFCVLIMDDKLLQTNEKIRAINEFKQPVHRNSQPFSDVLAAPMTPCRPGEILRPDSEQFHLTLEAVEDSAQLQSLIKQSVLAKGYYSRDVLGALPSTQAPQFVGYAEIRFIFFGIEREKFPREVPFFAGSSICQWMVTSFTRAEGIEVVVPVRGGVHLGQVGLALPRKIFIEAGNPTICIQATFPLAHIDHVPPARFASLRTQANVLCGEGLAGVRSVKESLRAGQSYRRFLLIRRKE